VFLSRDGGRPLIVEGDGAAPPSSDLLILAVRDGKKVDLRVSDRFKQFFITDAGPLPLLLRRRLAT
jgi:hypothetical protein